MSFLTGKTEKNSNVNKPTTRLQKDMAKWLRSYGLDRGLFPNANELGVDLQPYRDLFTLQNAHNFAQAKESAGNLTGSGFANVLGSRAGEAATAQGAAMADLLERRRSNDQSIFLQSLLGNMNSQAAGVNYTHSPGLLDYAAQGFSAAAPYLIGGPAGAAMGMAGGMAPGMSPTGYRTTPVVTGPGYGSRF